MKKIYHYIFYKLYKYMLNTPNHENAFTGAVIYLSMILLFYIIALIPLAKIIFGFIGLRGNILMFFGLLVAVGIYYFNSRYFKKNNRYLILEREYSTENEKKRIIGNILVSLLFISSIVVFIAVSYIANKR